MKKKYFNYFVSYTFNGGFGNIDVLSPTKIKKPAQLEDIKNVIKDKNKFTANSNVVILNYQLIGKVWR